MANVTTSQRVPSQPANSTQAIGTDILENILDTYENPTYHFRFYMAAPSALSSRQFNNQNKRVVIAESGVSPIDIDNIEITTTGSITKEAGTGIATNISFTLREPYGAELLDKIQRASLFLGIENFQKYPFFLELSFKGRRSSDLDNANPGNDADRPLTNQVWTWPIQLRTMAMNVNSGGSSYAIEAVAYTDHAYTNQSSDIEEPINIPASTVGEFFTLLQQKLNEREVEKIKSSNYIFTDTYTFYIDDEIYNASIVPDGVENRESRAGSYTITDGKLHFKYAPGESIEKIVRSVLSLTSHFQNEAKSTTDVDAAGTANGGEKAIYQTLWRLIADTDVGEYDSNRNDYQHHYKYLIIPYTMTSNLTVANLQSELSSSERYNSHKTRGLIRKKYDYIYSGRNDQVFDFELNFNFNWFVALPIQAGLSTQITNAEAAAKISEEQKQLNESYLDQATAKLQKNLEGIPSGALSGFSGLDGIIEMLKEQALSFGTGEIGSFENPFEDTIGQVETATTQVTDEVGSVSGMAQDGVAVFNEPLDALVIPPFSAAIPGARTPYGSIVIPGSVFDRVVENLSVDPAKQAQNRLRSIDFQLDDITGAEKEFKILATLQEIKTKKSVESGQEYAANAGQTLLSAIFEQAESPIAGDLLNIDLRIKGDPYWLEPNPHYINTAPTTSFRRLMANRGIVADTAGGTVSIATGGEDQNDVSVANTSERQTLMVFRSFTPQEFDAETGLTPPGHNSVNSLTGIYAVKEVTHSFSAGEFTQTLHGNRNVTINLRDVNLDGDVSDNQGGEYDLTISEFDGDNKLVTTLTPGDDGSLIAVAGNPTGTAGADFFAGLGLDLDTNTSGTVNVNVDDISATDIIGNAPVGSTPAEGGGT